MNHHAVVAGLPVATAPRIVAESPMDRAGVAAESPMDRAMAARRHVCIARDMCHFSEKKNQRWLVKLSLDNYGLNLIQNINGPV